MLKKETFMIIISVEKHSYFCGNWNIVVSLQDPLINKFKRTVFFFGIEIFCDINVFIVTFDKLNASLLYKNINFLTLIKKNHTW